MPVLPKVKIAVIGTGLIGPRHAQAVQNNSEAELTCIVDLSPAAEVLASRLGVMFYTNVEAMLRTERCDAAIVCTPNHTHVAISQQLLAGGVHVLVEKPISIDGDSAKQLVSPRRYFTIPSQRQSKHMQDASHLNLHLLVAHHRRFNTSVLATKSLIEKHSLGRVIALSGLWATSKPPSYFSEPITWRRTASSGGPILINLIHEIDILHFLFGPIARVYAEQTIKQRAFDAEEGAAIVLRFRSGVVGTFVLCDNAFSPWSFEMGTGENPTLPPTKQGFLSILGSEAGLSVGDMARWSYDRGDKSWTSILQREDVAVGNEVPFELQVGHLVKVVRGEEEPVCSGVEGLRALVVCEAVKKALEIGGPVEVE